MKNSIDYEELCNDVMDRETIINNEMYAFGEMIETLPEEYITESINVGPGETLRFDHKTIHLSSQINCEGNIEFDHCAVYYSESEEESEIIVERAGDVRIVDSFVVCIRGKRTTKEHIPHYLITCHSAAKLSFENTMFKDCAAFLVSYRCQEFQMYHCRLIDCYDRFMRISGLDHDTPVEITDSSFIIGDLDLFHMETGDSATLLATTIEIEADENKKIEVVNCSFAGNESFETIIESNKAHGRVDFISSKYGVSYKRCTFEGLSTGIEAQSVKDCQFTWCTEAITVPLLCRDLVQIIKDCRFGSCTNIINPDANLKGLQIENCEFVSCYNRILSTGYQGGLVMEGCTFLDISVQEDGDSWPSVFEIERDGSRSACLSRITGCRFALVRLGKGYLFRANGLREKPRGYAVSISACELKDCTTDRPGFEIMDPYIVYDTMLKKNQRFHAIDIRPDCIGFDTPCLNLLQNDY